MKEKKVKFPFKITGDHSKFATDFVLETPCVPIGPKEKKASDAAPSGPKSGPTHTR